MTFRLRGAVALFACLCLTCAGNANAANRQREYQTASDSAAMATANLASYNSFDSCGFDSCTTCGDSTCCGSCSAGGLGLGSGFLDRPGQIFFGASYIYARASLSEAVAYVVNDPNDPQGGQDFVEYDFDYNSSYGFHGGYRFLDCDAEIVFDFARYRSDADFLRADTSSVPTETILGGYEVNAPDDGTLQGRASIDVKSYDLGVAKTIPLGGCTPCAPGCADPCCGDVACGDPCGTGCGWCPLWDITWSAGVRFADAGWSRVAIARDDQEAVTTLGRTTLDFEGTGARVGLLGRRYFGKDGFFSIYASGDLSLLVGNMSIRTDTQEVANQDPLLRVHSNSARRMIPVTEIEAGATAHMGDRVRVSAGYFLGAWHDLGFRDTYYFNGVLNHYDDANILGFDGFFARAEVGF